MVWNALWKHPHMKEVVSLANSYVSLQVDLYPVEPSDEAAPASSYYSLYKTLSQRHQLSLDQIPTLTEMVRPYIFSTTVCE